jgi:hypothetical protein
LLEIVARDGKCVDMQVTASVQNMWPAKDKKIYGFSAHFVASFGKGGWQRRFNDFSRIKMKSLEWISSRTGKSLPFIPQTTIKSTDYFDQNGVQKDESGIWRFMFRDGSSEEISNIVKQSDVIQFDLWLKLSPSVHQKMKQAGFYLKVKSAQICDGLFYEELVTVVEPIDSKPEQCYAIHENFLANHFTSPNSDAVAKLDINVSFL